MLKQQLEHFLQAPFRL